MKLDFDPSVVHMFREEFSLGWTFEDDRRFWKRIQQCRSGLWDLRKSAKSLEKLCWRLSDDPTDREFMKHRLHFMSVCLGLSKLESTARIIYQKFPHFFARFAAEILCEMAGRAELILEEKAPHLLEIFSEADGQTVHTGKNDAAARSKTRRTPG